MLGFVRKFFSKEPFTSAASQLIGRVLAHFFHGVVKSILNWLTLQKNAAFSFSGSHLVSKLYWRVDILLLPILVKP